MELAERARQANRVGWVSQVIVEKLSQCSYVVVKVKLISDNIVKAERLAPSQIAYMTSELICIVELCETGKKDWREFNTDSTRK